MIRTRITEMLGIRYPIIGGTMMWISNADFVAAISNAGGLGILSVGQGIGICGDVPTVADLFDRMMAQAEASLGRFSLS